MNSNGKENKKVMPKISCTVFTYNRPHLVGRAIESILNQSFQDFELIIMDNGSIDNTAEVIEKYRSHEKVRIIRLEKNIGFHAAFNLSLDEINGEWFTVLSDDDYIDPNCFEILLKVPQEISSDINAVSCNGYDTLTKGYSGLGLYEDQYLPLATIIKKTGGDFWGISKTELIGDKRMNVVLGGLENTFWYQIDAIATRYYIHRQLITYDTDHGPRITSSYSNADFIKKSKFYKTLLTENFYWNVLKKHNQKEYKRKSLTGLFFQRLSQNTAEKKQYEDLLKNTDLSFKHKVYYNLITLLPSKFLKHFYSFYKSYSKT